MCKKRANRLQNDCKTTAKKGKDQKQPFPSPQ